MKPEPGDNVMWQHAVIGPDADNRWIWAEKTVVGIPAIIRLLVTLHRSGIRQVTLLQDSGRVRPVLEKWSVKKPLPHVTLEGPRNGRDLYREESALWIQGGILFESGLIRWFEGIRSETPQTLACVMPDGKRLLWVSNSDSGKNRSDEASAIHPYVQPDDIDQNVSIPDGMHGCRVLELTSPGGERRLLEMTGKPDEAPHVKWFRNMTFPAIRVFSKLGVSPNQVTWAGFVIGLAGALILAFGNYWGGVLGALLLCVSWIFDNMDGTLARVTFSESDSGQRLDAALGHLTNLAFFAALVWSVYGTNSPWTAVLIAVLMLGSITLAHGICRWEGRLRGHEKRKDRQGSIQVFLDQINGRDFTVLVLLFALFDGFKFFLWGSVAGLQVFWMMHLWLIHQHQHQQLISPDR